jgi:hypothetical protein
MAGSSFWDNFFTDPREMNAVAGGFEAGGKIVGAMGQFQYGQAAQASDNFQADQLREQANDAQASGQRQAAIDERQARYVASNALAAAAASGGGASDPTVINLIAGIAQEGSYRQQVALYQGDERGRLLRMQAAAREQEGANKARQSSLMGGTSLLSAGASLLRSAAKDTMYERNKGDGPPRGALAGFSED